MLRKHILGITFLTLSFSVFGKSHPTKRYTRSEYIDLWKNVAINQMKEYGIPASITLAQAILESGDGNSELARGANNHFGIKCHGWSGKKVYHDDDKRNECFRKYTNARESFKDHSIFLQRSRYRFLFDYNVTDYKSWAKGLKQAGYATNPKYPELLIRLIEENNLAQYDRLGKKKDNSEISVKKKKTDSSNSEEIFVNLESNMRIQNSSNRIKYVITDTEYSVDELATRLGMGPWQIRKYNDISKGDDIFQGQLIYLQPKRGKNRDYDYHIVKEGETLRMVSQRYGVKMKKILKYSQLPWDYTAEKGDTLRLN
ncbi:MAG: glucosaminidase domain-containing protein [Flavobacteriales bacterium]|nr:glucosaminidase domain-containing protein [Flavobacteriales bacterium]